MKKFISVIAIVLALAMTVLSLSSCVNLFISEAALASISERILEGVNKMSSATALDADMNVTTSISYSQFSFISIEIPVNIKTQFNVTDKTNPSAYFAMDLLVDMSALQMLNSGVSSNIINNQNINAEIYYSDGTMYFASDVMGETDKRKTAVDMSVFSDFTSLNIDDMHSLVFFDEDMIKSASLHNGSDGSLTAKVTVDSKKALKSFLIVLIGMYGDEYEISSVSDEEIFAMIDEAGIEINDAKISITVDKDNNVTNFKISGEIAVPVDENGETSMKMHLALDADFNPVGDDFRVKTPEDIESFEDSGSIERNDNTDDDDCIIFIPEADGTYSEKDVIYSRNGLLILNRDGFIIAVKVDNPTSDQSSHKYTMFPESNRSYYLNSDGSPKQTLYDALGIAPDDFINTAP